MSPIPWNEKKPVPNFALGMQGTSRMEGNGISGLSSSAASDYDRALEIREKQIASSRDDLLSAKGAITRGSRRLVPLSHPAVDVPLCMECQVIVINCWR